MGYSKSNVVIILVIFGVGLLLGYTIRINFTPFPTIELVPPKVSPTDLGGGITTKQVIYVYEKQDITFDKFSINQEIYSPGENATIEFIIKNTLSAPYNISVFWYSNSTRYSGWSTTSTKYFDPTVVFNGYHSWLPVFDKGEWEVQVIVNFSFNNRIVTRDNIDNFRVI
ncbi:MAG: hypothetical protein HYS80_01890 [Candidatus Aenigmarchaeota archaeon]|nr:hypothetical protein [Candidatus Aenigmarchaeota archaeon]